LKGILQVYGPSVNCLIEPIANVVYTFKSVRKLCETQVLNLPIGIWIIIGHPLYMEFKFEKTITEWKSLSDRIIKKNELKKVLTFFLLQFYEWLGLLFYFYIWGHVRNNFTTI